MQQPDVWWDGADRASTPELVSEAAMENLATEQPVPDEVA
jgi:amidase